MVARVTRVLKGVGRQSRFLVFGSRDQERAIARVENSVEAILAKCHELKQETVSLEQQTVSLEQQTVSLEQQTVSLEQQTVSLAVKIPEMIQLLTQVQIEQANLVSRLAESESEVRVLRRTLRDSVEDLAERIVTDVGKTSD